MEKNGGKVRELTYEIITNKQKNDCVKILRDEQRQSEKDIIDRYKH